jgi:tetratricopeptide (TPR) repeat protein
MKTLYTLVLSLFTVLAFSQDLEEAGKQYTAATQKYRQGNYKEAIAQYTTLLNTTQTGPLRIKLYINIGLCHHELEEYDKAIASFNEAIKLDNTDMLTYIDRGLSELNGGKIREAKEDFAYVISKNADTKSMESALYWTARINYSQKNLPRL